MTPVDFLSFLSLADSREPTTTPSPPSPMPTTSRPKASPLLSLPLEIRLKIYAYLLPPRTHAIVTQYPHNGFFYNTSTIPQFSAQTFYPFGRTAPKDHLTTYKVLSTNFRNCYPSPTISPEILRTCRQCRDEGESVLYGGVGVTWDFGVHLEAVVAFFGDRSPIARASIRSLKIAKEIPPVVIQQQGGEDDDIEKEELQAKDPVWIRLCSYLLAELPNLRTVDLTVWSSICSTAPPSLALGVNPMMTGLLASAGMDSDDVTTPDPITVVKTSNPQLKEWEWIRNLLHLEVLRSVQVTWWGFSGEGGCKDGERGFDAWLARRMVGDRFLRDRMIREGVVVEGVMVVPGSGV